ncbi:MAG: fluoride efflux transporter CrcB [Gammaproteobacteria bacterium]
MKALLLVAAGGAIGSVGRYLMSGWVTHHTVASRFPWGTFAVNALGCLLAGLAVGYLLRADAVGADTRVFLFAGVLGGFTTFSAFGIETVALMRKGEMLVAGANAVGSVAVALFALWLGMALARG